MARYELFNLYIEFGHLKKTSKKTRPRKRLVTKLGKFVERLSFLTIGLLIAGLIASCAFYFTCVPDTNIGKLEFPTAIYFSVVSFTSLGYGDVYPLHFGKVITGSEVLIGLMLVAVFIGKIASERQSALTLLVYTSEQERRIREFYNGVKEKNQRLQAAVSGRNLEELNQVAKETYGFISSICSYLIVQAEQGDVAAFGNISSLRKLYSEFYTFQMQSFKALKIWGMPERTIRTYGNIIGKLSGNAARMRPFHKKDERAKNILSLIIQNGVALSKWNQAVANGSVVLYAEEIVTPALLQKIGDRMKTDVWTRDIYKTIAVELNISNRLAQKCLRILIDRNEINF